MIFGAALNSITHDADEVLELEEGVEDLEEGDLDLEEGGEVLGEVPEGGLDLEEGWEDDLEKFM